jgi:hypothetical protein
MKREFFWLFVENPVINRFMNFFILSVLVVKEFDLWIWTSRNFSDATSAIFVLGLFCYILFFHYCISTATKNHRLCSSLPCFNPLWLSDRQVIKNALLLYCTFPILDGTDKCLVKICISGVFLYFSIDWLTILLFCLVWWFTFSNCSHKF